MEFVSGQKLTAQNLNGLVSLADGQNIPTDGLFIKSNGVNMWKPIEEKPQTIKNYRIFDVQVRYHDIKDTGQEKDDSYETHEIDISKYIDYNDNKLKNILINKINNYSDLLLMKANLFTQKGRNFKESYKIICEANDNNINKETFIQYILSCVNKEYGNKFSNVIDSILRKEFK